MSDLTLQNGKSLTLSAGTVIRFATGKVFNAQGTLITSGTAAQPVLLTSNQPNPAPGDWGGLSSRYNPPYSVSATLTNLIVEYAGKTTGARPAVDLWQSYPVVDSLTVRNSFGDGIHSYYSYLSGTRLSVLNSGGRSIYAYGTSSSINISNAQFVGNAQGIQLSEGPHLVNLRLAHWGSPSGPSGVGPGTGDAVVAGVLYEPWLAAAPSSPNYFTAVTAKNRSFNPNVGVVAHIDHTEQLASTWTLRVYSGATLIRALTGTTAFAEWDGRDTGGTLLPDGTYRWEISASAPGGNATPASGLAILDSTKQLIEAFAISERYFSPNGDAAKDSTTASAAIGFGDSTWTLRFKDAFGTVVRTTSGAAGTIAFLWDGKNDAGVLQPDGVYTAELTASNLATNVTQSLTTDLDVTAPVAAIATPLENQVISNLFSNGTSVRASAQDARLMFWTLDSGVGQPPSAPLTRLAEGSTALNDEVATVWSSAALTQPLYTLRLTVHDLAGNRTILDRHVANQPFAILQKNPSLSDVWEFNPDNSSMPYRTIVPFKLRETLFIRNAAGETVRTLVDNVSRNAGTWDDTWDGRDAQGSRVPDGPYFVVATVTFGGNVVTWDRSNVSRPLTSIIHFGALPSLFDPFDNIPMPITFTLDYPQRVAIEVSSATPGIFSADCEPSAVTVCIADAYFPSGIHTIEWPGTRPDGTFYAASRSLGGIPKAFSENATVVYGSTPVISAVTWEPALIHPASGSTLSFNLQLHAATTANVSVRLIRHETGESILTLTRSGVSTGLVQIPWDGLASNGLFAPAGSFTGEITVTDSIGNVVTRHAVMTTRY